MVTIRKPKNALKFRSASGWWGALWREALPAGNGLIGAAVNGGAADESIMLTHSSCLWQGKTSVLQDVSDKIKEVRRLMELGEPKKAQEILSNALITKNYRPQVAFPLPVCDLRVRMPLDKPARDYMRVINMENGEVSVVYRDGNAKFERSLFVSRANDTVVYELNRSGGKSISCKLSLDLHDRTNNRTPLTIARLPERVDTKYENYFMYFAAKSDDGTDFGAVAKVSYYGGSQRVTEDGLEITGANSVLILVRLFVESQREKEWKSLRAELAAVKLNYDKMLKEHTAIHSKLFLASELNLEAKNREAFCEDLIAECQTGEMPLALVEKLWGYARYLFLSSTRETGLIPGPNGLWCGDYRAENPQASLGGELQLLYALCNGGGLASHMGALIDLCERLTPDFKKNAQRLFNCRGVMVPLYTSPNTGLPGNVAPQTLHYVAGAGWLANMFYETVRTTGDKKLLKEKVLPFMRETAAFFEDFLKVGRDGKFMSVPSYSPDNTPGNYAGEGERLKLNIAASSTLAYAVFKRLLDNLIAECAEQKALAGEAGKWKEMRSKLPAYRINADGAIAEYISPDYEDNYEQRLCSHLYPVFSGEEMDEETRKAFLTAARKRLEHPGDLSSVGYGWLALAFAKLGESDLAETCLANIVKYTMMNNLVTAENDWRGGGFTNRDGWACYNIAGNVGFGAAVTAGLVDSAGDRIVLLPAPLESYAKFELKGAATTAATEVSLTCDRGKGNCSVTFKARRACRVVVKLPESTRRIVKPNNIGLVLDESREIALDLAANKSFTLELKI